MSYALGVRIPVVRTYPSEVEIPGKLFIHLSAYSDVRYPSGTKVMLSGTTAYAEVHYSSVTSRCSDTFKYRVTGVYRD